VLAHSSLVSIDTLIEVASTKGQGHLLAISGRANLPEEVTDVIIGRGERQVIRKLAGNTSAHFSEAGYSGIIARAGDDDELTETLGLRVDLPVKFLRELLRRAKDAVRARLLALAPPAIEEEIRRVLDAIAHEDAAPARSFGVAEELVKLMLKLNELDDAAVYKFAEEKKFDEVAAALALLNDVPTEMMMRLLEGIRSDLLLIPCRSARLNWPTVESILRYRPTPLPLNEATLEVAQKDYRKLSIETAQRAVRFWRLHDRIEK
jgi:uncharacterized protein (DUF2336 family)